MFRIFLSICIILPAVSFSQNYIGKNRSDVKKELKAMLKMRANATITLDTDTAFTYSINDKPSPAVDVYFGFSDNGKCQTERLSSKSDTCTGRYLKQVLDEKKWGWKKINENQYISSFEAHMMLEITISSSIYSYAILQTDWNKEMYELLTK